MPRERPCGRAASCSTRGWSPTSNTSVVHRWYRGNELRQSIRLDVPARRQGFRTFSRATVTASEGEWRVELRTRDGQILHTERFTVR